MRNAFMHAVASVLLTTSAAWAADDAAKPDQVTKVEQRMENFKKRIDGGKSNKSLTSEEAAKVDAEYGAIQKMIVDAKSDGKVTPAELQEIHKRQAAFSKEIFAEKHDTQGTQLSAKNAPKK